MAKQTYTAAERKAQFLKAGLAIAKKDGIAKVSVAAVAAKCSVTAPLVFHVFGTRDALQTAIKREAKKQKVKLAEPKPAAKTPARKRTIAEVKAIKNKAAGKKPEVVQKIVAKRAAKKATAPKTSGKNRAVAPVAPKKVAVAKQPTQKYQPNPVPQAAMPAEPKASL